MGKTIFLKDAVAIIPGYSFRMALHRFEKGETRILQAKNILGNSTVEESELDRIKFDGERSQAIVLKDDVIISARGSFRAGIVPLGVNDIIAASSVYILRRKNDCMLPNYLAIFLNSNEGQRQLNESATGAGIKAIRRIDLEKIRIHVPAIATQDSIIRIYRVNNKLKKKLTRKIELLNNSNEFAINKLIKQSS